MIRRLMWSLAVVLAATPGWAQEAGAEPQATFTAGVDFVLVDAIVTDDAGPVTDLTADDFSIVEDGEAQAIEEFRLVRVDGSVQDAAGPPMPIRTAADERREAARDDVRVIVFFLDDYHTQFGTGVVARDAIVNFVRTSTGPNDLLAVMGPLTPVEDVRLTRDHDAVVRQIEAFEGRRFRYDIRNAFEEAYAYYSAPVIESLRNQVVISALRGLATHLGAVREGRKSIVYVGEGMAATLPAGIRNLQATAGAGGLNALDGNGGGAALSQQVFRQADLYDRMRDVYNDANRNNTAIYTVDPRGLGGGLPMVDQDVDPAAAQAYFSDARTLLRTMAEQTDGRAIVNTNDMADGLAQVLRDSSAYYLIGYTSPAAPDGEFHEIEVRVDRPGVRVRARRGYWAATEADVLRAVTPVERVPAAIENALASIAAPVQARRYVRLWLGAARGDDGRTRVSLVWEPQPAPPGVPREPAEQVMVTAVTAERDLLYRGRSPESAGGPGAGPFEVSFDADPGVIDLDLDVEGAGGILLDSETRRFEVPDLSSGRAVMSEPRVFRARNARELRDVEADPAAVPTPGREFRRAERVLIRFDVYGDPAAPVAALLNRTGGHMADLPVTPAEAGGMYQIDVGFGAVPPGEYLVEIAIPGSDAPALVPLRVEG